MKKQESNNFIDEKQASNNVHGVHLLILIAFCSLPLLFITGCGIGNFIQCSKCGDDNTRMMIYSEGTDSNGVEYTSCVGPAGILGFGLNSSCWPTECVKVKQNQEGGHLTGQISGCVTYYNDCGCIDKSEVKSEGKYSASIGCLGINCTGVNYVETTAETTTASEQNTCLGINCGGKTKADIRNYNSTMPRQFRNGCWSSGN